MRCVSALAVLLAAAAVARAGGINTDAALTAGQGERLVRVKLRYESLEQSIDGYLAQTTIVYRVTPRLTGLATIGYRGRSPGPDGFTDLFVRGRFKLFGRDRKRETLTFSVTGGVEAPTGSSGVGSPDGGLVAGLVGTFERNLWRVDADVQRAFRPQTGDFTRADVAIVYSFAESDDALWQAVLEFNYERRGRADVLFVAPGLVYELRGWKLEASVQIAAATDAVGPAPEFATVFSVVRVF